MAKNSVKFSRRFTPNKYHLIGHNVGLRFNVDCENRYNERN